MRNILDYIVEYGGFTFQQKAFNEADALVLSRISYLPFDGIVSEHFEESISVQQASKCFLESKNPEKRVLWQEDIELAKRLIHNLRYRTLMLSAFVNQVDLEQEKQFCAVCIRMAPDTVFVSFRGTDNTLVGWKEDFNMSFCTIVPSQRDALLYLNRLAEKSQDRLILGGHSKGGNLAVYAAAFAPLELQSRIGAVYNNDGPGFQIEVLSRKEFAAILDRIHTFIPQSSVVGRLLEHGETCRIVKSRQIGILQHDIYSWEIAGSQFVYLNKTDGGSVLIDRLLKSWILDLGKERQKQVVDLIYSILGGTNAKTTQELTENWRENARRIRLAVKGLGEPERGLLFQTVQTLLKCAGAGFKHLFARKKSV